MGKHAFTFLMPIYSEGSPDYH